mmetsp:Transcript_29132/g.68674  ORF Transcript_29132/g.68674 Transcript_29132/m.68674 type:complete len:231 (-) Transcript_29132:1658-2350(-)
MELHRPGELKAHLFNLILHVLPQVVDVLLIDHHVAANQLGFHQLAVFDLKINKLLSDLADALAHAKLLQLRGGLGAVLLGLQLGILDGVLLWIRDVRVDGHHTWSFLRWQAPAFHGGLGQLWNGLLELVACFLHVHLSSFCFEVRHVEKLLADQQRHQRAIPCCHDHHGLVVIHLNRIHCAADAVRDVGAEEAARHAWHQPDAPISKTHDDPVASWGKRQVSHVYVLGQL